MHSAIFEGSVRHRRMAPRPHRFRYRLFMLYLDLAELDTVFEGSRLFSCTGRAPARFRRSDHLGDPAVPLDRAVRDLVEERTGRRPDGPIRLLTHLRYFGYVFNPVSFYYCFDRTDSRLDSIVAEVNNTPWGERHCYVLEVPRGLAAHATPRFTPAKQMHVSPFMPMDVDYDWRFGTPGPSLGVHMANFRSGRKLFDATLVLRRREITPRSLARMLWVYPLITAKVIGAIHWQALCLWLKRTPVFDHPDKAPRGAVRTPARSGNRIPRDRQADGGRT